MPILVASLHLYVGVCSEVRERGRARERGKEV